MHQTIKHLKCVPPMIQVCHHVINLPIEINALYLTTSSLSCDNIFSGPRWCLLPIAKLIKNPRPSQLNFDPMFSISTNQRICSMQYTIFEKSIIICYTYTLLHHLDLACDPQWSHALCRLS